MSCFYVGVFRQLYLHNVITKLGNHFIDGGPCVNSIYFMQFYDILQLTKIEWF